MDHSDYTLGSLLLFDFFAQVLLNFTHVLGFDPEGLLHLLHPLHNNPQVLDLLYPLLDVHLVLVNVSLDHRNIIDYFFRLLRHDGDLSN